MDAKILISDAASLLGLTSQAIHKRLKSNKLPFQKSSAKLFFKHETAKSLFKIQFKKQVISIQIIKGGTGKSTITHSLAVRANLYGARVLCIDLDQQANLTQAFGFNPENAPVLIDIISERIPFSDALVNISDGLDLLPSRMENAALDHLLMLKRLPLNTVYKDLIDPVRNKYDLILIDCPPALGQSVAAAALSSDFILAPVTPEKFSLSGLRLTAQEIKDLAKQYKMNIPLKLVLNKFDSRTSLSHETLNLLVQHPVYSKDMFKSYIRVSQEFPNIIAQGVSIYDSLKNSTAKEDIDLLTREILQINNLASEEKEKIPLGSLEAF